MHADTAQYYALVARNFCLSSRKYRVVESVKYLCCRKTTVLVVATIFQSNQTAFDSLRA